MSRKIDISKAPAVKGSGYPAPYGEPCVERLRHRLGDAAGLTQFGVNLTRLPPGCWSSQRHWHESEDEFVFVVQGEVVLITDAGEETLRAGDCAGFKAGVADGHQLQNRSTVDALVLEIGTRGAVQDGVTYPDIGLQLLKGRPGFLRVDGQPYVPPGS